MYGYLILYLVYYHIIRIIVYKICLFFSIFCKTFDPKCSFLTAMDFHIQA